MDWILDHLQLVIAGAGAIAWWLSQRKAAAAKDRAPEEGRPVEDTELAQRTRQIRADIQRKIEERLQGHSRPERETRSEGQGAPPPILQEVMRRLAGIPEVPPPLARSPSSANRDAERAKEILEHQASLAERLRAAQAQKEAALKRMPFETEAGKRVDGLKLTRTAAGVRADLRSPEALRRAFVLREVLGPPVALR